MQTGYVITCPNCGKQIDDFSLADEWFCECGASGLLAWDEDDEDVDWPDDDEQGTT